jgi:hypothetical protein
MSKPFFVLMLAAIALAGGGCASGPKTPPLSPKGEVVAQGSGPLSFRASERGMVSVYDVNMNTVVHAGGMMPGSLIMTNPAAGNISVTDSGSTATQNVYSGLNRSHRYEVWFIPATGAATTYPSR